MRSVPPRRRILVADDSPEIARRICTLLAPLQAEVLPPVADGHALVDHCRRLRPDVAIVDVQMPGLNGIDALHALAREPRALPPVVIVVTGLAEPEIRLQALAAGAQHVLGKFEDLDHLPGLVAAALDAMSDIPDAPAADAPSVNG